nr:hypothetical protein [Streptomyces sp. IMTB 1903]
MVEEVADVAGADAGAVSMTYGRPVRVTMTSVWEAPLRMPTARTAFADSWWMVCSSAGGSGVGRVWASSTRWVPRVVLLVVMARWVIRPCCVNGSALYSRPGMYCWSSTVRPADPAYMPRAS